MTFTGKITRLLDGDVNIEKNKMQLGVGNVLFKYRN
jgi:hypothetical protein